jgi:hypothetical protein
MSSPESCADIAIGAFVKKLGRPYWPNWAGLIPGDTTNGWNASKPDWRVQADSIMDDFELCCGVAIGRNKSDIDKLRSKTLSLFSDYLVEKASIAAAARAVELARERLAELKASIKTFPVA